MTARPDAAGRLRRFRAMLRIRAVQLRIESLYHLDEMKTPVHLCIGQEAVAVGACDALERRDYVSSNHRGHGHYLAKGGDLKGLVAELYCRETGCSKGRGGSMHLVDASVGDLGSSSIVGGGIPIGTGLAFAAQREGKGRASAVFFGDGAADEGVLYESVNFAVLKRLPVIFVYENNGWSVCSAAAARQAAPLVFHAMPPRALATAAVDGNDVEAVHAATAEAVERARRGGGPSLVECRTYRMRGHAGAGSDLHLGYRPAEEVAAWERRDPVERARGALAAAGELDGAALSAMETEIGREIDEAFRFAQGSPLPRPEDLLRHVYAEEG